MRHRVHHAEERVGEGHAGHRGGVGHLLAGDGVGLLRDGRVVAGGQPLEDRLQRADREAVGVVRGHHRGVGLEGVADGVDARGGGEAGGRHHLQVGVDNRHVGHELVVGKRVLRPGGAVRDDGEGRDLGAGAGRGRDRDEVGLVAHVREGVDALADVHEAHRHVLKIDLGVLVQYPHDLCGVHRRTAADRDDDVGLEALHHLGAHLRAAERRVGSDLAEGGVHNAHLVELTLDRLCVAVRVQEAVGDDEGFLFIHNGAQLVESDGQTALLDIYLFRRSEPKHIVPPLGYGLDVQQVLDADVLVDRVAAP